MVLMEGLRVSFEHALGFWTDAIVHHVFRHSDGREMVVLLQRTDHTRQDAIYVVREPHHLRPRRN